MFISEDRKQNLTLNRRTFFLYIFKLCIFSGVSYRLYDLQIVKSKKYKTLSKNNQNVISKTMRNTWIPRLCSECSLLMKNIEKTMVPVS